MNNLSGGFLFFLLLLSLVVGSCDKKDLELVDEGNNKPHVTRADHAKLYAGRNRALISWPHNNKEVVLTKVFWNKHADSLVLALTPEMDSVKLMVNNLQEGDHLFEIFTYNKDNLNSGKTLVSGFIYGDSYASKLVNRSLYHLSYLDNTLKFSWNNLDDKAIIGSEVVYKDVNGIERTVLVDNAPTNIIHGVSSDKRGFIKYRTVYAPNQFVIDTLYTKFTSLPYINRKAVFDSLPGWKFRCRVMAEAKTIADYGGSVAFAQKMDEAMVKASKKFQVQGLNDAGNNEIHFYMIEMNPFEGRSSQFTTKQWLNDNTLDLMLVVNDNAAPDDDSWGWRRSPYLTLGHDYKGLFGASAIDALAHEFGHARGMYDLYLGEVPKASNNPISGEAFESKTCIMNYPYGETVWSEFSRFIINASAGSKVAKKYWDYFPAVFKITIKQKNGAVAKDAKLSFYPVFGNSNAVRETDVIKYRGTTGSTGTYTFPDNPYAIDGNPANNVYNYVVQIEYNGKKEYRLMPMDDALIAGSKNQDFVLNVTLK